MNDTQEYAYIGRADCGCLVLYFLDVPMGQREFGREAGEVIRGGGTLSRMPSAEAEAIWKAEPMGCQCKAEREVQP